MERCVYCHRRDGVILHDEYGFICEECLVHGERCATKGCNNPAIHKSYTKGGKRYCRDCFMEQGSKVSNGKYSKYGDHKYAGDSIDQRFMYATIFD